MPVGLSTEDLVYKSVSEESQGQAPLGARSDGGTDTVACPRPGHLSSSGGFLGAAC